MATLAIQTQGLGKSYRRYASTARKALEFASFGAWRGHEEFWALRDVDLEVPSGAALGLVGRNGAGKSTLLRLLAGISCPSAGRLRLRGPVASLLDLGAGFHLDLSGRENIALAGLLLGIPARAMRAKEGAILEFSELGEFIDQPVRTYSAGMAMRLGFSIAAEVDPAVLLIDEVFAVGDQDFQRKCVERVMDFRRRGTSLVLCSHSLYDLRQICDVAAWIDSGKLRATGDAVEVTNAYAADAREVPARSAELGGREARIESARLLDAAGSEISNFAPGEELCVRVAWSDPDPKRRLSVGVGFVRQDRTLVAAMGTHLDGFELATGGGEVDLVLPAAPLLSGTFDVVVWLFDAEGVFRFDEHVATARLRVQSRTKEVGLVRVEHRWRLPSDR